MTSKHLIRLWIFLLFIVLCPVLSGAQPAAGNAAPGKWAVVNVPDAPLRAEAGYSSECVSQSRMGMVVEVLDKSGYWVKVRTPEPYVGWVNELALARRSKNGIAKYVAAPKWIVTAESAKVMSLPDAGGDNVCRVLMGNIVLKGADSVRDGWCSVVLPDGRKGWIMEDSVCDFASWASAEAEEGDAAKAGDIVSLAKSFMGCTYVWGGISVGHFDCSGLTGFCYFMNGILLPRDASQQAKCGVEVKFEDMQAGDLVFFGNNSVGHVGICIGNHRIIHCSQLVRINSLVKGEPDYYSRKILHIRRILGHIGEGSGGFTARAVDPVSGAGIR